MEAAARNLRLNTIKYVKIHYKQPLDAKMTLGMLKRTPGCRKGVPRCQMRPGAPKRSVVALKTTAGAPKRNSRAAKRSL